MRQPSISELLRPPRASTDAPLQIVDLFCGAGGFSTGAVQAGHELVLAVDASYDALRTHRANHPRCEHLLAELPLPASDLPLPRNGRPWHLHGSPPCQHFSMMQSRVAGAEGEREQAASDAHTLVEWYLQLALASDAASWSMEQVATPLMRKLAERVRRAHPRAMAWGVFDLSLLGVPQTRRRLIAGTPALVARLRRLESHARRRSVRDVLGAAACRGTHLRSAKRWAKARLRHLRRPGETKYVTSHPPAGSLLHHHSVDGPAPTVCCSGWLTWHHTGRQLTGLRCIHTKHLALLQTFPATYKWPRAATRRRRLIGNALPCLVARLLMQRV